MRPPVRTQAEKDAFFATEIAAELGALHQRCCREDLEYPGACERTTVSAGSLGIKVQQSHKEWAAFQSATHFWADWDAALAECWPVYRRAIKAIGMLGPGPRADSASQRAMWAIQVRLYGQVLPARVWREREKYAKQQLAERLHLRPEPVRLRPDERESVGGRSWPARDADQNGISSRS